MGWSQRLSKHLQRHAPSKEIQQGSRHHLQLHIPPRTKHGHCRSAHVWRKSPRRSNLQHLQNGRLSPVSLRPHRHIHSHHPFDKNSPQVSYISLLLTPSPPPPEINLAFSYYTSIPQRPAYSSHSRTPPRPNPTVPPTLFHLNRPRRKHPRLFQTPHPHLHHPRHHSYSHPFPIL